MEAESEYTKQAANLLAKYHIQFQTELIGSDCPMFCQDAEKHVDMDKINTFPRRTHIHGKHYRCFFTRQDGDYKAAKTKSASFDFWNSYHDEEFNWLLKNAGFDSSIPFSLLRQHGFKEGSVTFFAKNNKRRTPTAYDLLTCIQKSDPGTFDEFCSEFGYDTDSRKAEQIHAAVVLEWHKVRDFFTPEEIEALQEVQ
jgi:hypothetical protein